ncbi:uncharacterized protein LOC109709454 [Ananas comosus]|uniref:Uncharacterized protein LOC109709454 n=1 Tax=Ananas comosus TaxID=4615 RepID=A0A6P5EUX1_ANACO|nr:uncharacterized protein LOC109709454 [Ananas comosus]
MGKSSARKKKNANAIANANANANAAAPPKTSASRSSSSANHDGVLAKSSAIFGPRIPGNPRVREIPKSADGAEEIGVDPEGKEVQGKALVDSVALGYSEERIKNFGRKLKERRDFFPCTISVSQKTKRKYHHKRRPDDLRGSVLSNDFIEKQRAYFAEVDAFQLPEEEVSEGDLE